MKKIVSGVLTLIIAFSANAQSKKTKDRDAIKEMCGCFEVTYNFAETFNYTKDSTYRPSATKLSKGLEWAVMVTGLKPSSIQNPLYFVYSSLIIV